MPRERGLVANVDLKDRRSLSHIVIVYVIVEVLYFGAFCDDLAYKVINNNKNVTTGEYEKQTRVLYG